MKRIWDFSKRGEGGGGPGTQTLPPPPPPQSGQYLPQPMPDQMVPPPPPGQEPEPMGDDMPERYLARPIRPVAQLAVRVGLWGAVILGCLGGIRALVLPGGSESDEVPLQDIGDADIMVPATVAGVAEDVVQAWLTATPQDQETLDRLFVNPPTAGDIQNDNITLVDMRTVAGERIQDGYWTVTVATDLIEADPNAPAPEDDESGEPDEPDITTWYVEVGIVGDAWGGMAAITTPAVVPAPPQVETRLEPDVGQEYEPEEDDPLTQAVDGFLSALLAGDGDVGRYVSPDAERSFGAASPAPFTEIEVLDISWTEIDEDDIRVWVQVRATTPTDTYRTVAYEITARERLDRWEVINMFGSPTVRPIPEDNESDSVPGGSSSDSTAEDESSDTTSEDSSSDDESSDESSGDSGDESGSEPEGAPPPEEGSDSDSSDTTDTTIPLPAE